MGCKYKKWLQIMFLHRLLMTPLKQTAPSPSTRNQTHRNETRSLVAMAQAPSWQTGK